MTTLVDFVIEYITEISESKNPPILFQRDGSLFVVSSAGYAQLFYGLDIDPSFPKDPKPKGSVNTLYNLLKEPLTFIHGENEFFDQIMLKTGNDYFSIADMQKLSTKLDQRSKDKMRMLAHTRNYYNGGHTGDSIVLGVHAARVMRREQYLYELQQEEGHLLEVCEQRMLTNETSSKKVSSICSWPDCVIVTPNLMITLPRAIGLKDYEDRAHSRLEGWTSDTKWNGMSFYHPNNVAHPFRERGKAFAIHVTENVRQYTARDEHDYAAVDMDREVTQRGKEGIMIERLIRNVTPLFDRLNMADFNGANKEKKGSKREFDDSTHPVWP